MNKYDFVYKLIKSNGDIEKDSIKAKHQRNAKAILKLRFPGCKITYCRPDANAKEQYGSIGSHTW